jgi:hypothetical protein
MVTLFTVADPKGVRIAYSADNPHTKHNYSLRENKYRIIYTSLDRKNCEQIKDIFRKKHLDKLVSGKRDLYKMKQTEMIRDLRSIKQQNAQSQRKRKCPVLKNSTKRRQIKKKAIQ